MSDPKHPTPGDLMIDASDVTVVDVTSTKVRRLIKLRAGYAAALGNLAGQPAAMLSRAGVDAGEVSTAVAASGDVARLEQLLPAAEKLVELLRETYLVKRHTVAAVLADAAAQAKRRAKRDPKGDEILAALDEVLVYAGAPSKKANATKIKTGKIKPKTAKTTSAAKPAASP